MADSILSQSPGTDMPRRRPHPILQKPKCGLAFLTPEEFPAWDALIDASPQGSLFCKSWWLKAACGEVRVLGYFEGGQLIAGIPIFYTRRKGLRLCCMPTLTQTMGIVIAPLKGKHITIQNHETGILDLFAERLMQESIFIQAFHPASHNWLPFYWRGFSQTTHYTYVLDDLTSVSRIWDGMGTAKRAHIRNAQKNNIKVRECSPETVFNASMQTFSRQKKACPYTLEYLYRLYDAARANDAGICMAAEDDKGRVHSAALFVWDRKRGYYLAGGHDSTLTLSGGSALLVWGLIEFAAAHTAIFDFEGSMHKSIETSFRYFGAARVAYNRIVKFPRWLRIALAASGRTSF